MKGLLNRVLSSGTDDGEDEISLHQFQPIDRQTAVRLAESSAEEFLRLDGNLLSCFELRGPYGLFAVLQAYLETKGLSPEVLQAVEDGDHRAYVAAMVANQQKVFFDLYMKGALARLQIVPVLPVEALAEWLQLERKMKASEPKPPAAPQQIAPVAIPETPAETCAREFKELGSQAFRNKYVSNSKNRVHYETALSQGLL